MTIRPKSILELFALFASVTSCTSFAQIQASSATLVAPLAASAPTAVPALVPYSGVAVDREGRALSGETGVTFLIYKDQNAGEPLFAETQSVVADATGHYTVRLGATMSSGLPLDLFSSGEARWLEVQIAGEKPQARVLLISVPYALKAADAATLGGFPASAFALAGSQGSLAPGAVSSAGIVSNTTSNVTTTGGTSGYLPVFTGASTVVNSKLYSSSTGIGVGDVPNPSAAFDVNGKSIWRGLFNIVRAGNATTSTGYASFPMLIQASAYNSSSKAMFLPSFQLQVEPAGNNTANTGATFNFLYTGNNGTPAETGLYINDTGTIHFASGQTFPGTDISGAVNASSYELGGSLFASGSTSTESAYLGFAGNTSSSGFDNTGTGSAALRNNTSGYANTANGTDALYSNTTGENNTATGDNALSDNTDGNYNTADGADSLSQNTTGYDNTATGTVSLQVNSTGSNNTADGTFALNVNTTGSDNTASGVQALSENTTGSDNTANGFDSLALNTTGNYNTATGLDAMFYNTTGFSDTANGVNAMFSNSTGAYNTADGDGALYSNTSGGGNTASGLSAMYYNTTGGNNTAAGLNALLDNTTGGDNTAVGYDALYSNQTGSDLTAVGYDAQAGSGGSAQVSNATSLGAHAVVDQNNSLVLGQTTHGSPGASYVNVGIGTATPRSALELAVNAPRALGPVLTLTNSGAGGSAIDFNTSQPSANSVYAPSARIVAYNNAGSNEIAFQSRSGQDMQSNLVVSDNGSVYMPGGAGLRIDNPNDPANKYLVHSSVQSSELMNIYTGNVVTDELGLATVKLPEWFEAENSDFRYQLTIVGRKAQAWISQEIKAGKFQIASDATNTKVSWQVTAVRQDAYAKAHPLIVEQAKPVSEGGFSSHPELYGQPASAVSKNFPVQAPEIAVPVMPETRKPTPPRMPAPVHQHASRPVAQPIAQLSTK